MFRFYADDIVIIGDVNETREDIKTIEHWCKGSNMIINRQKSGILAVHTKGRLREDNVEGIPRVGE